MEAWELKNCRKGHTAAAVEVLTEKIQLDGANMAQPQAGYGVRKRRIFLILPHTGITSLQRRLVGGI